jgi:hypothetical protein
MTTVKRATDGHWILAIEDFIDLPIITQADAME